MLFEFFEALAALLQSLLDLHHVLADLSALVRSFGAHAARREEIFHLFDLGHAFGDVI